MAEPVAPKTLIDALRLHPRVAYQGFFNDDTLRTRVLDGLPTLVPFRDAYHRAMAIVDWDHRLPSKQHTLRLYLYYNSDGYEEGETAYDDRVDHIGARDRYPEFDVPDFADLPSDETYEAQIEPDGSTNGLR